MSATGRVPAPRVADVLASIVSRGDRSTWATSLVADCAGRLGAVGVGLSVADEAGIVGVAAATTGAGRAGAELQFALGEGPCHEATRTRRMVHAPFLASDGRWLLFAPEAARQDICAAFSTPLQVGAVPIGALDAYRNTTGGLSAEESSIVAVYAQAATAVLLLSATSDDAPGSADGLVDLADIRPVVHQAAGMVAIQLDVDLTTALLRLRAHAFSSGLPLRDLAHDVVTRRVAFDHSARGLFEPSSGPTPEPGPAPARDGDPHHPDFEQRNP